VFSDVFTLLKLAGIAGLIIVGLGAGSNHTTDFTAPLGDLPNGLGSALAIAMVGVLWSYGGWQHASFLAGEARDAQRTIPLAMIFGAIAVTMIYLLINVAYMFLLITGRDGGVAATRRGRDRQNFRRARRAFDCADDFHFDLWHDGNLYAHRAAHLLCDGRRRRVLPESRGSASEISHAGVCHSLAIALGDGADFVLGHI